MATAQTPVTLAPRVTTWGSIEVGVVVGLSGGGAVAGWAGEGADGFG
jgi:hypothetical protein